MSPVVLLFDAIISRGFAVAVVLNSSGLCDNHDDLTYQFEFSKGIGRVNAAENKMTGVLALETATDACSVAVCLDGEISERHAVAPRQHSQLVFTMLGELLARSNLGSQGIDVIAYGAGPGSFTGLRIAASTAQGLAFSSNLPAIGVPTLAVLAQGALRRGVVNADDTVLCVIDARINEIYSAVYVYRGGLAVLQQGPWACAPAELSPAGTQSLRAIGNGCDLLPQFPPPLRARICSSAPGLLPVARDAIPLAMASFARGETQSARMAQPVYVRDEIAWKKLSEQSRPH
jgi:tRNA threonylcarbamoyladenosine biosynthesis protein TsaB